MIILDSNYSVNCDGYGTTLNFQEQRERKNKITNEIEFYLYKDQWHYLSVTQAISKYKDLVLENSEDLKDVLKKLDEINLTIKTLVVSTT